MGDGKFSIVIIIILSILTGFFSGATYITNYYNPTITQTSIVTIPVTKVVTTTITTTVVAGNQNIQAAPVLNTVFAYKSNVYMVSSEGTIVTLYLPDSYIKYAGEIANFYSWYNPHYIRYVHSMYIGQNLPNMPSGDDENYLKFSSIITKYFHYDTQRMHMIKYSPKTKMPLQVLNDRKGICGDYMHFWALIEVAENRKVTLVDIFAENKKVGHAFIIDDNGHVIENNGHVIFNTDAAFILWYNYFGEPLTVTYFYVDPDKGITYIREKTISSVPLTVPANIINATHTIAGVSNGLPYTATATISATGGNVRITSIITVGKTMYTKYVIIQDNIALIITKNSFGTVTSGMPCNTDFYYAMAVPDYLKFKNIVKYYDVNNTRIYILQLASTDTLIATSFMNKITATRIIKKNNTVIAFLTYTANVFYS